MPNTLKTSAIDLCNIFVTKAMQQTARRESLFWWKDDAMMALKAIQQQLKMLPDVQNLAFAVAIADSICELCSVVCEHCCDNETGGLASIMDELQEQLTKDYAASIQERNAHLKLTPMKRSKRKAA